jgi:hypothetical protein
MARLLARQGVQVGVALVLLCLALSLFVDVEELLLTPRTAVRLRARTRDEATLTEVRCTGPNQPINRQRNYATLCRNSDAEVTLKLGPFLRRNWA